MLSSIVAVGAAGRRRRGSPPRRGLHLLPVQVEAEEEEGGGRGGRQPDAESRLAIGA